MCGIAGFSLSPTEIDIDPADLARELAHNIMSRGRDATGAAWVDPDSGEVFIRKAPVSALRFHSRPSTYWTYENSVKVEKQSAYTGMGGFADMDHLTSMAIIHTRFATQGDPADSRNNHPLRRGPVIGVHNGCLWNDDALFKMLDVDRDGEVDSEAIFALLENEPHIDPWTSLDWIDGTMAVAWFDTRDKKPTLHLARNQSSPIHVIQTKAGSLVFASESRHVLDAVKKVGLEVDWEMSVEDRSYLRIQEGRLLDYTKFTSRTLREDPNFDHGVVQGEILELVDRLSDIEDAPTATADAVSPGTPTAG